MTYDTAPADGTCDLPQVAGWATVRGMEYQVGWVSAGDDVDGQAAVNRMLAERVAGGWQVQSHSVVKVESTGQFEYLPQGHPLFTHFFLFHREAG